MEVSGAVLARRLVFWAFIGLLVAISAHDLRDRAREILLDRETMLRRTDGLAAATERLTMIFDSHEVITTATELAAQLVSPPGTPGRRAQYTRVSGSTVTVVAQYDETGLSSMGFQFPLSEHPILEEVIRTGVAANRPIDTEALGPEVRQMMAKLGLTHGVYVPVYLEGSLDGVLSVPSRGQAMSADLFEYCKAVGHLTELALGNARNHELLAAQATTDELTGLANRRAFDQQLANRPGRLQVLRAGPRPRWPQEGQRRRGPRRGRRVARPLLAASCPPPCAAATRSPASEATSSPGSSSTPTPPMAPRPRPACSPRSPPRPSAVRPSGVSIGIASGGPESSGAAVSAAADAAMYRAKRGGGRRYILAADVADDVPGVIDTGPVTAAAEVGGRAGGPG